MSRTGRPKAEIDLQLAYKLGLQQCTMAECSAWLGVPLSTLSTRPDFSEAYKKGKEKGKMSLRRYQWELARTNATMAIFLGKQYLGQSDQVIVEGDSETIKAINRLSVLVHKAKERYEQGANGEGEVEGEPEADQDDDAGITSVLASGQQGAEPGETWAPPVVKKAKPAKAKSSPAKVKSK